MSESRWHRRVDGVFFLLVVLLGLMIGIVGLFVLPALVNALGLG
jgi:hypothetical protein